MRAKHSTQRIRTLRRRRLALALVAAMALPSAPVAMAQSLPQGGNVVSGTATINSVGNNTTINQSSRGAIIDWGSFNIASGFGVNFQNGTGVTLNRVIGFGYGPSASFINGSLTSTGTVFLVNRAGITFGGGAQVNVGGLVASTVDILDADFLTGTSTGRYLFRGVVGTGGIRNSADLVVGSRGVGFVGPNLVNDGSIVANGGSIGFAAGTTVTLDYVGDGLTQVTIDVPPAVDSAIIQSRNGSMTADGGRILLRTAATAGGTGGGIYASGTLRAQTISNVNGRIELTSNGGPVMLGAPGFFSDANSPFTRGTIDVSGGAGETGGSVLLQGNQVFMVNEDDTPGAPTDPTSPGSVINAWGGDGGGTVDIFATDTVTLLPHTVINADATDAGNGGIVRVVAGGDILSYANISANAGQAGGNGGLVGLVSQTGNALVAGNLGANGSSSGDGGDILVSAVAGAAGTSGAISANGGVNGGSVQMVGGFVVVGSTSTIEADGSTGTGGSIDIGATNSLAAYGILSARGGTVGGGIYTATGGDFDIQGLRIDAGSSGIAGNWTFQAPNITVVNGNDAGPVDGVIQLGEELQDGEINTALANGTNVTLRAGAAPSDGGNIRFNDGVDIFYDDGTVPLLFRADANGSITGSNFSIATNSAALSMAFNADASNLNNGFAGISFTGATLDSNGGDIQFYGQSDLMNGMASSYDTGVELIDSSIATAGGNVLIRGASTGGDAGSDDAGVVLDNTNIDAGAGGVSIYGTGAGVTSGVILGFSTITAGGGGVLVDGQSAEADGLYAFGTDLVANGGAISLRGMGGAHGVYFDGGLYSYGGNISLHGEGGTAEGIDASGPVDSEGGDITMYGYSAQAIGLDFGEGANSGMVSAGGDISLTGIGLTGGVALRASNAPVIFFGPADVDEIDSGGGVLTVTGSASGAGAVGVYLDGVGLVGGAGDVTVDGSAPLGIGVLFANGAGVSTTTGAITLLGEGAEFGLDIADGAIDTDSGDITLVGDALDAGATAGVRVAGAGLSTSGGNITVTGASAGGVGVQLGDGVDPFAIGSGGGAISITGSGVTAGVLMQGNQVDSGGGAIDIAGDGTLAGVVLEDSSIDSGNGDIGITGSAIGSGAVAVALDATQVSAGAGNISVQGISPSGTGIAFLNGSMVSTTSGAISLIGEGADFGLDIADGAIDTDSGDILLDGTATATTATAGVRVTGAGLTTNGGTITVSGVSAGGVGVQLGDGSAFAIGSGGGAISITGSGIDAGVLMQGNQVDSGGGAIAITGSGEATGVSLDGGEIDSGGGAIDIEGTASANSGTGVSLVATQLIGGSGDVTVHGTAAAGIGVLLADGAGVSTTTGAISLYGEGADFGLDIADGAIDTESGDITLDGQALAASATAGVRVTGGGLVTNGGNITVTGSSAGGVGVQLGDGSAFAIGSGGGAISITGSGIDAGVLMQGNQVDSGGGAIAIEGVGTQAGIVLEDSSIDSGNGAITMTGSALGLGPVPVSRTGVLIRATQLIGGAGDVTVRGTAPGGGGVVLDHGAGISTTSGAIRLYGTGADSGVSIYDSALDTDSGDILLDGIATATTATAGVRVTGDRLTTNGGSITVTGVSAGGLGVELGQGGPFAISSGGGAISITGTGFRAGVRMVRHQVDSGGGDIDITGDATASGGIGVDLGRVQLVAGTGDVRVKGSATIGTGVLFASESGITTTTGDISLTGIGEQVGLELAGGEMRTDSGHFDLRGRGMGAASDGLVIGSGTSISTNGGGIDLSGEGVGGAGVLLEAGSSVDAGNSLVILRGGNDGSSDAVRIGGTIRSEMGVNLRPGGVDANGGLTERTGDEILVGGGTAGFALSGTELAMIDAPELVIGSNLHAGAIRVLGMTARNGNLTLQNDGGGGGIDLQAAVDVGIGTLALSSGGSITQTSAGAITAHSLLARADGDVLLAVAGNNVAATTLAGSAGGDFQFQDVDTLAIGNVSAIGFDATEGALSSFGASGITAGGDVFVRNLAGDLTLDAGVTATNIDLVTAGRLQNVTGASLSARGDWRVWANTWEGETRGGLAGSGNLPNLYGCAYLGACGVTVPGDDNHFIYVQQPTALVTFDSFSREYGLPNPLFTFSVTGAILGDTAANVASGSATTTATIGSDVGNYAISGNFLSAAGYRIQFVPGNLAITPATLFFTADNFVRYLGTVNPTLTGSVTGFRNDDTLLSVFGSGVIWSTPAGLLSPIGYYPVNGGTTARNYVFSQAPGNATALRIIPLPQLPSTPIDFIRETVNTYLYDRNIGGAPVCAINASMADQQLASAGDELSNEWSKVRSRPNLTNCFESERKNSCGDF